MIGGGRRKVPRRFTTRKSLIFGPPGRPDPWPVEEFVDLFACGSEQTAGSHMLARDLPAHPVPDGFVFASMLPKMSNGCNHKSKLDGK